MCVVGVVSPVLSVRDGIQIECEDEPKRSHKNEFFSSHIYLYNSLTELCKISLELSGVCETHIRSAQTQ